MLPPHPDGVELEGNLLLQGPEAAAAAHVARATGLGFFSWLDDNTILAICKCAEPNTLGVLSAVSDAFSAFAAFEEHWRMHCLKLNACAPLCFCGSWKSTFVALLMQGDRRANAKLPSRHIRRKPGVSIFSDVLYMPHQLTHGSNHFGRAPRGPLVTRISAEHVMRDLAAFADEFESGAGKPAILVGLGVGGSTSVGSSSRVWDEACLRRTLGDRIFHAGGVNFKLSDYLDYAKHNTDDQPLYLFDPTFGSSAPELLEGYEAPVCFRDDLFSLLEDRPDYRWLLLGGARSGQTWHKDPNGTSAWNLTLRGRKRWLFFPPHVTPPGVFPAANGGPGDYVTPLALAEWARDFYGEALKTPGFVESESGPGDVTFVPRGWWHMVLNVAPLTVAVSHHFLSPAGLHTTLRLLRETPEQVSGIDRGLARDAKRAATNSGMPQETDDHNRRSTAGTALHDRLVTALKEKRPAALEAAERLLAEEDSRRVAWPPFELKKIVTPEDGAGSFSFSF